MLVFKKNRSSFLSGGSEQSSAAKVIEAFKIILYSAINAGITLFYVRMNGNASNYGGIRKSLGKFSFSI